MFAYLQLIKFVVSTCGSDQSKRIINTRKLESTLDKSHVKLPISSNHEWIRQYCNDGGVELKNKVLNKWETFFKDI